MFKVQGVAWECSGGVQGYSWIVHVVFMDCSGNVQVECPGVFQGVFRKTS